MNAPPAPAVSVIIPAFNRGYCLAQTLQSVLAQTFTDFEVIVVDDGSTDDTAEVARSFGERVRLLIQKNSGVSAARNAGLRAAGGRFIAFQDSDDSWQPEKLARQMAVMQKHAAQWCATMAVDHENAPLFDLKQVHATPLEPELYLIEDAVATVLKADCHPYLQSMLLARSLVEKVGWFDEALSGPEDTDYIFRLAKLAPMYFLSRPLATVDLTTTDSLMRDTTTAARMRRFASCVRVHEKIFDALPADSAYRTTARKLACFYSCAVAELACVEGNFALTRRWAACAMSKRGRAKDVLRSAAIRFWPSLWRHRLQKKWGNPAVIQRSQVIAK